MGVQKRGEFRKKGYGKKLIRRLSVFGIPSNVKSVRRGDGIRNSPSKSATGKKTIFSS
jgi:hypothetical protein